MRFVIRKPVRVVGVFFRACVAGYRKETVGAVLLAYLFKSHTGFEHVCYRSKLLPAGNLNGSVPRCYDDFLTLWALGHFVVVH